jgi:hypothetical protein
MGYGALRYSACSTLHACRPTMVLFEIAPIEELDHPLYSTPHPPAPKIDYSAILQGGRES